MSTVDIDRLQSPSELFADLSVHSAPAEAQPLLAKAGEVFGFVPNLAIQMAAVPVALEGYFHVLHAFGETPLSPIEQQVVLMAASRANEARYSLAVHATLATKLGADSDTVKAVGTGGPINDAKLAALRRFTEALALSRGHIAEQEVSRFLAAGYGHAAIVAVAFGIAVKTFANTLANVAETPVDDAFVPALARVLA
jgi:AhpD family alkylhydroperoxidase